jgi:hypothetical protein
MGALTNTDCPAQGEIHRHGPIDGCEESFVGDLAELQRSHVGTCGKLSRSSSEKKDLATT